MYFCKLRAEKKRILTLVLPFLPPSGVFPVERRSKERLAVGEQMALKIQIKPPYCQLVLLVHKNYMHEILAPL